MTLGGLERAPRCRSRTTASWRRTAALGWRRGRRSRRLRLQWQRTRQARLLGSNSGVQKTVFKSITRYFDIDIFLHFVIHTSSKSFFASLHEAAQNPALNDAQACVWRVFPAYQCLPALLAGEVRSAKWHWQFDTCTRFISHERHISCEIKPSW